MPIDIALLTAEDLPLEVKVVARTWRDDLTLALLLALLLALALAAEIEADVGWQVPDRALTTSVS